MQSRKQNRIVFCAVLVLCIAGIFAATLLSSLRDRPRTNRPRGVAYEVASDTADPKAVKVLLVGNSILYTHDVPKLLAKLFDDSGRRSRISAIYGPSYSLKRHWEDGALAQALGNSGKWDYVVLWENTEIARRNPQETGEYLDKLKTLIDKAGAHTVFVENYTDFPADEEENRNNFLWLGYRHGVRVLPFGSAWNSVRNGFSDIHIYAKDEHHPSKAGSVVEALTIYTALVGEPPVFSPEVVSMLGIDPARAKPLATCISTALTPDFDNYVSSERMIHDGAYARCVDANTALLAKAPKQSIARYYRAYAYNLLGDHVKALADWTTEAEEHPAFTDYKIMKAATLSALGKNAEALSEMQAVRADDRRTFYYLNASAFFKLNAKDYAGAIEDCDESLKLSERENKARIADSWLTRARAEYQLGHFGEARANALKCADADRRGCAGAAYHVLAECAKRQGDSKGPAAFEDKARKMGFAGYVFFSKPSDTSAEDTVQANFKYREDTPHLSVFFKDRKDLLRQYADTAEALVAPVQRMLNSDSGAYPVNVYAFDTPEEMQEFASKSLNYRVHDALGVSIVERQCVLTSDFESPATAIHELTHTMIQSSYQLHDLERWAEEGLPELFEKFYGYKVNGKNVIYAGFQNPLRLPLYDTKPLQWDLGDVVAGKDWSVKNASAQRLAAVFLFQQGKLPEYIRAVQTKNKHGFKTYYEAAFGETFEQLKPKWHAYRQDVVDHLKDFQGYPNSHIYASKNEFDQAVRTHHIDLEDARLLTDSAT